MDSRIGLSTNASLVLHAYPWGKRYHVTRFSRWRTTLSVIQIPSERIDIRSKHLFLGDHLIKILTSFSFVVMYWYCTENWVDSWKLPLCLEQEKVDPWKSLLGLWLELLMLLSPNKRKRPQNILNEHYLNFAKKYKRVCFLATNKQTGSSSENRSFFRCFCLFLSSFFFLLLLLLFLYRCLNYFREFISLLSQ